MLKANEVVTKSLEIIHYLRPKNWWIENPKSGYLKSRGILDKYPYVDVDYCQFSTLGYQNPTRFWGSVGIVKHTAFVILHVSKFDNGGKWSFDT